MSVDGSDAHQVSKPTAPAADSAPSWSPDGASLVFNRKSGASSAIFTISAKGSDTRSLTPANGHYGAHPAWSPDGTRILFGTDLNKPIDSFYPARLFTIRPDGTSLAPVTEADPDIEFLSASWSPDSKQIIAARVQHSTAGGRSRLVTLEPRWHPRSRRPARCQLADRSELGPVRLTTRGKGLTWCRGFASLSLCRQRSGPVPRLRMPSLDRRGRDVLRLPDR